MVVRKIVNIDESLCNGCGNCIPQCAEGALEIVNSKARIVKETYCDGLGACVGYCPQGAITIIEQEAERFDEEAVRQHLEKTVVKTERSSVQSQWPVKLTLVPIQAPFFEKADLLLAADCAPVAYPKLHNSLLIGKRIIIGCPKFEDARTYAEKLGEILKKNDVGSITIVYMEVPCCFGLKWAVDKALQESGKKIPVKQYVLTIGGEIREL